MDRMEKLKLLKEKYDLDSKQDFWNLTGNVYIITHNAVQKIAKMENVIFEDPIIIDSSREHCVLKGNACIINDGKKISEEWTFGEADLKLNCKNKYPYAMAEKRLKDRLTLKLISAYEYGVYSEEEADDFKRKKESTPTQATPKQQNFVYKMLDNNAFNDGENAKIKEEFSYKFEDTFASQKKTSEFINELKTIIANYKKENK